MRLCDHGFGISIDNCHPDTIPCSAPSGVIDPSGAWVRKAPNQGTHLFAVAIEISE